LVVLILQFFSLGFSRFGIRQFFSDPLFALVDGMEDRLIEEALHQPKQDEEVERLSGDRKPIYFHDFTCPQRR